jgi:[ribosomal protein S18]-alanine N-acetyltransferase
MGADPEDLAGFLRNVGQEINFAAYNGPELCGFLSIQPHSKGIEIGLGLRPDLTGQGLGLEFVQAALAFTRERHQDAHFVLNVATFNDRAIRTYERAGFVRMKTFMRTTNGGDWEFAEMVLQREQRP